MINNGNLQEALTNAYRQASNEDHPDYQSFHRSVQRYLYEWAMTVHQADVNRSNLLQALSWHCIVLVDEEQGNQPYHIPVKSFHDFCVEMVVDEAALLQVSEGRVRSYKDKQGRIFMRSNEVASQFVGRPYSPPKANHSPQAILKKQKEMKEQKARQALLDSQKYTSPKPNQPIKVYQPSN